MDTMILICNPLKKTCYQYQNIAYLRNIHLKAWRVLSILLYVRYVSKPAKAEKESFSLRNSTENNTRNFKVNRNPVT